MLERRIDEVSGGNQADFARRIDVPRQTIHRILTGITQLPEADVRRKLAPALGIRHVDFFVLVGELLPDEIPEPGAPREPFPAGDKRREVLAALEQAGGLPDYRYEDLVDLLELWSSRQE